MHPSGYAKYNIPIKSPIYAFSEIGLKIPNLEKDCKW